MQPGLQSPLQTESFDEFLSGFVGKFVKIKDKSKAKLMLVKLIHLFAREVLLVNKLEIEETKTT